MGIAQRSRQQLAVSGEVLSRVVVVQDRYRAREVGLLQFPGSTGPTAALTRRSGSARAHPTRESYPHIHKANSPPPPNPLPRLPPPVFISHLGPDRRGPRSPGSPPATCCRAPDLRLHGPDWRATAAAPLRLNGYSPRSSGTGDGAARRAPDARRHGGAGHLRLRDTAPEVGEGQQARGGSERGPWRRARFPPCVRVGGSVSLPRFSRVRAFSGRAGTERGWRGRVPGVPHLWIGRWEDKWRRP